MTPIQILLVEDNPGDATLIAELLGVDDRSFVLVHVDRLALGLQRLKEDQFDAVLLDLRLPDATGLEAVRAIRAQTEDRQRWLLAGSLPYFLRELLKHWAELEPDL